MSEASAELVASPATGKVVITDSLADGPVYLLRLQAKRGTSPARAIHLLRAVLKISKRRFGLRCLDAREDEPR
jgi:hypothetical protein